MLPIILGPSLSECHLIILLTPADDYASLQKLEALGTSSQHLVRLLQIVSGEKKTFNVHNHLTTNSFFEKIFWSCNLRN